ncbi:GDSL-type esterase/lipase family protein [Alicyclobacillus fodiniaquatilis]|uniref:GDSL-type esterase/lipase family protein n=1 Tax=Alicyclobacillus fodiniaquatilis TaxID=1661150 RepID=A0ABW4JMG2_9BACL
MRKRKKWMWIGSAVIIVCIAGGSFFVWKQHADSQMKAPVVNNPKPVAMDAGSEVRVMAVGGSVAHGWDDNVTDGGYLARAFKTLSQKTGVQYQFLNKSVEGDGPDQMAAKFPALLKDNRPQVLVISWGMLDDISKKTPVATFKKDVHSEIQQALAAHMKVLVVTPPVTAASYAVHDGPLEDQLVEDEIQVAQSFHSSDVYVFNVFDEMKSYLTAHHQDVSMYEGDGWHPNAAGHELAGQLLAQDMLNQFVTTTKH